MAKPYDLPNPRERRIVGAEGGLGLTGYFSPRAEIAALPGIRQT